MDMLWLLKVLLAQPPSYSISPPRSPIPPGAGSRADRGDGDPAADVGPRAAAAPGAGRGRRAPALPHRLRRPRQGLRAVQAGRHLGAPVEEAFEEPGMLRSFINSGAGKCSPNWRGSSSNFV